MNRVGAGFSLVVLTLAQTLGAAPLLWRKWRRFRRRRDAFEWSPARLDGRWLQAPSVEWQAKTGPHLTFFVDGFAETRMAVQLTRALEAKRPAWRFSLAIRNLRDAEQGHAIPPDMPLSALPFDYFPAVKKWFSGVRPDGVILVEKLFYPNFVRGSAFLGARVVGVNSYARATDCERNPAFKRWILAGFASLGVRSPEQQRLLQPLLGEVPLEITGSLKFPPPRADSDRKMRPELEKWLDLAASRPIIAAGSVEAGEIEILFEAFALLRQNCDAVLLWAPRHIESAGNLAAQLEARGWSVARRSENLKNLRPDVLLLDSMGELAASYQRCQAAFVGGTFAGGGHNVLEPLGSGIPVVFGPKRGFFAAEQAWCEEHGVGFAVQNAQALAAMWQTWLQDTPFRGEVRGRIISFVAQGQRSWQSTIEFLLAEFDGDGERD